MASESTMPPPPVSLVRTVHAANDRDDREQLAIVRALLDEAERALDASSAHGQKAQLAQELSRLGGRLLELSADFTHADRAPESDAVSAGVA